ncbi:hypothetical protein [Candidatus Mycosynbacter amalyticus]|nr:hypothetical protein [Candidatus Mycosynbacter amalyticus]
MIMYESFQSFWERYSAENINRHGFRDWSVVNISHTSDKDYSIQQQQGLDKLGFQPLVVTEAHPFSRQTRQSLVKHVPDQAARSFIAHCRNQFYDEFSRRAGSFCPDTFKAFAEYDSWDAFYNTWLERDGKPVFHRNIPLLVDHTPQVEYWMRTQTGQENLPYQRLLITTYFVAENRFFDFFIKHVTDEQAQRINLMTQSRIGIHLDLLYADNPIYA